MIGSPLTHGSTGIVVEFPERIQHYGGPLKQPGCGNSEREIVVEVVLTSPWLGWDDSECAEMFAHRVSDGTTILSIESNMNCPNLRMRAMQRHLVALSASMRGSERAGE